MSFRTQVKARKYRDFNERLYIDTLRSNENYLKNLSEEEYANAIQQLNLYDVEKIIIKGHIHYGSLALESDDGGRWGDASYNSGQITITVDCATGTQSVSGSATLNQYIGSVYGAERLRIRAYYGVAFQIDSIELVHSERAS